MKVQEKCSSFDRIVRGVFIGTILGLIGAILIGLVIDHFRKKKEIVKTVFIDGAEASVTDFNGQDFSENILRFHVKANSDSEDDIELKYAVRDEILDVIGEDIADCNTKEEVVKYLEDNINIISDLAQEIVYSKGYGYDVNTQVEELFFPMRQYGEIVIPAGLYEALNVDIGEADGENFWCLLYPTLCYPIDSAAVVSRNGEEEIARELSAEEYEKLFVNQDISNADVEIRFKLIDWLQNTLFNLF